MACNTIEEILNDCSNPIGGIKRIYLNDQDNVVSETVNLTAWTVTVSASTSYETIEFRKNLGTYTEDYSKEDDGAIIFNQTITIPLHGRDATKSRKINILAEGQRYLSMVVEMNSGAFVYFDNVQLTSLADGSGAAKTEASKYTITFVAESTHLAYFMSSSDVASII